jgi:hypothetical protein
VRERDEEGEDILKKEGEEKGEREGESAHSTFY